MAKKESESTIKNILDEIADEQGWKAADKLNICILFIEQFSTETVFENFILGIQDEENEEDEDEEDEDEDRDENEDED